MTQQPYELTVLHVHKRVLARGVEGEEAPEKSDATCQGVSTQVIGSNLDTVGTSHFIAYSEPIYIYIGTRSIVDYKGIPLLEWHWITFVATLGKGMV